MGIKIHGPWPSAPTGDNKFEILLVKIFIKKRKNQILSAILEKIKFFLFKKTAYDSFKEGITMGKCKTAVQAS